MAESCDCRSNAPIAAIIGKELRRWSSPNGTAQILHRSTTPVLLPADQVPGASLLSLRFPILFPLIHLLSLRPALALGPALAARSAHVPYSSRLLSLSDRSLLGPRYPHPVSRENGCSSGPRCLRGVSQASVIRRGRPVPLQLVVCLQAGVLSYERTHGLPPLDGPPKS